MRIFQVFSTNELARNSVTVILNNYHGKRIKQKTLDFYRNGCNSALSKNSAIIWLVSINEDTGQLTGMSVCAVGSKTHQVIHSITVVDTAFRKSGLGKKLLDYKLKVLKEKYPKSKYRSFVASTNEAAVKMCSSVGLIVTDEKTKEKENRNGKKVTTNFFVFKDL